MLSKPMDKAHYEARCHMVQLVPIEQVVRNNHNNQMKIEPFKKLLNKINETTFSIEEL